MEKLVQFGAGNIGRSFVGQLFSRSGYEVVFVDIDDRLIQGLNRERSYRVIIKHSGRPDETLWIRNVRAVNGRDKEAVEREVADASVIATAVGQHALQAVMPAIAGGLERRRGRYGKRPVDIIIAENLHLAADFFRRHLRELLPSDYPFEKLVGLVETSIGKMVPIMRERDLREDPLWVFAEPYNRLILDKHGFKNPIPRVVGLAPMENMKAYVARKLFIHNLGHAATAYFGYQRNSELIYIYEVLEIPRVFDKAKRAMMQSAESLCREYPQEFTIAKLEAHADDLLFRFQNRALGDTVYRVGRDLYRKLGGNDRLLGALRLGKKHGCVMDEVARAVVAGVHFRGRDEKGELFPGDKEFVEKEIPRGLEHILTGVSGLARDDPLDGAIIEEVLREANSGAAR